MSKKLLPCPFCGGEATIQALNMHRKTHVFCLSCFATSGWGKPEEAFAAWNRRDGWISVADTTKEREGDIVLCGLKK